MLLLAGAEKLRTATRGSEEEGWKRGVTGRLERLLLAKALSAVLCILNASFTFYLKIGWSFSSDALKRDKLSGRLFTIFHI